MKTAHRLSLKRTALRIVLIAAALAVVGVIALWGISMPVRNLPEPTGPFLVGTVSYDLTDTDRLERYSPDDAPPFRRIRLQLWYPADAERTDGRPERWMPDGLAHIRAIVRTNGFPGFIWDHTVLMRSNSYRSAPVAPPDAGRFPVVLISHGWSGYRGLHSDLAEELASHGYIVAAAEHTYGAAAVLFDDGELIQASDRILPSRSAGDIFLERAAVLVRAFSDDNRFVLEHLSRVHAGAARQGPPEIAKLTDRLDLGRIGLIGHSTGGGAMVDLSLDNEANDIGALIGLDAWVEPIGEARLQDADYTVPSLFLRSEQWEGGINDGYLLPFIDRIESDTPAELMPIEGAAHEQFTTLFMYRPAINWVGFLGSVDPVAFAEYQRRTVLSFMDGRLRGGVPENDAASGEPND